ncbi:hypothetical protein FGL86_09560 [Pistricoccus aurantiacus]|uniref:HEAT repeat domain-containing protein n=1 Tax=Pistricoccus aurantiacus TaxID=1883414 RepID=A0A5B8SRJ5_9GAMM|nr:hypothetical protein [Pistricoccus aurantiacus]QEA39296.1 hypothetical protein FGL86_09560 [Pistricoccus aurantiacus]
MPHHDFWNRLARTCIALTLLALGVGLELFAIARWLENDILRGAFWHLLALAPLTVALKMGFPKHMRRSGGIGLWLLLLCISALMPLIGPLGLAFFVLPALHRARPRRPRHWRLVPRPEYPQQALSVPDAQSHALRSGLASVLSHAGDTAHRQRALIQAQHLPRRQVVTLMRQGLADGADDVRLLGYSMLNALENDLERQIRGLKKRLETDEDAQGRIAEAIARLYGEYGYLELAQGSALGVLLDEGLEYLHQAQQRHDTAARWKLRARLYLLHRRYDDAHQSLDKAAQRGLAEKDLADLRAELALHQRRLPDLRHQLKLLAYSNRQSLALRQLMEYWQCNSPN